MYKRIKLTIKNSYLDVFIAVTPKEVVAIRKQQAAAKMSRLLEIKHILERELSRVAD